MENNTHILEERDDMKHYRIILVLTVSLSVVISSCLHGQIRLGPRLGMNIAYRSSSESLPYPSSESYRTGFVVGLTAQQDFVDILSLIAEPVYIQKGNTTSSFVAGLNQTVISKASYLEIPVAAKLHLLSGLFTPYMTAGLYISFLLSANGQTDIGGQIEIYDQKEFTRPIEIGVQGGIGGQYNYSTSFSFFGEVKYSRGLSKILKEPFSKTLRSYGFLFIVGTMYTI